MKQKKILDFKPIIIGINLKEQVQALRAWEHFVEISNSTISDIVNFMDTEDCSTKEFLELTSLDPKNTIIRLYENYGNVTEGMSTEKLIELNLISNVHAKDVKENLYLFKNAKVEAIKLFNYDLANLRDKDGLFNLNTDFKTALQEHFTVYTNSPEQNKSLKHLNQIIKGFNYFIKSGLIRTTKGTGGLLPLLNGIKLKTDKKGFEPVTHLFKLLRWKAIFK